MYKCDVIILACQARGSTTFFHAQLIEHEIFVNIKIVHNSVFIAYGLASQARHLFCNKEVEAGITPISTSNELL